MPITFEIDAERGHVETRMTGPLLDADPIRYLEELLEHPAYRPGLSALIVCEDLSVGGFSSGAITRLASFTRNSADQFKASRVAVVARQPVVFGLVRMYQLLRNPLYDFRVFRDEAAARAWLDARTGE